MLNPAAYKGREQTYVKHFVLEKYLERVAYNIFSFQAHFAYVDGFSGPWKSANQSYEDTSFKIATDVLLKVQKGLKDDRSKTVNFRCLFIEKSQRAYKDLETAVANLNADNMSIINGSFEDSVNHIYDFCKGTFSLIFIDPTGWQGFAMERIRPLLSLRGEVLINFMSDFITRFIDDPRPEIAGTFDELFGPKWHSEWKTLYDDGLSREAAAIEVYTSRLKQAGNFKYVTSTRILKPTSDRSYFYLIYATEHWKGIQEFRAVEKKAVDEQERVRDAAKIVAKIENTGQGDLLGTNIVEGNVMPYAQERKKQLQRGYGRLLVELKAQPVGIKYEVLLGAVLETPLVWESDLKDWLIELKNNGAILTPDFKNRQRVPQRGNTIRPVANMLPEKI
jgi:three-Cys-motif partner protein